MARRLQEELYGGAQQNAQNEQDEVRAPMARTTETLVGPEDDFDDGDMHTSILSQVRARQQRGSMYFPCVL